MKKKVVKEVEEKRSHPIKSFILRFFFVLFLIFIITAAYGFFVEAYNLKVNEYKIVSNKILDENHGLKVVHISDLHYGTAIQEKQLKKLVEKINLTKPDIIVFTGDLIDRHILKKATEEEITIMNYELTENLSKLNATIGKYAVTGNHDKENKKWAIVMDGCDFINLNDTFDLIYQNIDVPILLAGISSNLSSELNVIDKHNKIKEELADDIYSYAILILHEPDYIDYIDYSNYDLILSGHSHNGQIRIPFVGAITKPVGARTYYDTHYKLNTTDLFISNGVGTTVLDIRLFNKPSFNLYRLTNK